MAPQPASPRDRPSPTPSPVPEDESASPVPEDEGASPDLPLTMSASVMLADLPRDASAALASAGGLQGKVVVRFKAVGAAPSLAQDLCKISAERKFEEVVRYLRRKLRCSDTDSRVCAVVGRGGGELAPVLQECSRPARGCLFHDPCLWIISCYAKSTRRSITASLPHILDGLGKRLQLLPGHWIRVLRRRVPPALDVVAVRLDGPFRLAPHVAILFDKLGEISAGRKVADHVRLHEHLSGAARPGTDADRRDGQLPRHQRGNLGRHRLQHDAEAARLLHRERILEEPQRAVARLALHAEASQGVLPLGSEADVTEHGDAGRGDSADRRRHFLAALELDALDPPLLDGADRRAQRLLWRDFIRAHRQIANLASQHVILAVAAALTENLAGVLHAERDHGQAVANENHVHARVVGNVGAGEVVRREHGDGVALFMQGPQGPQGHLFARV
ncbi:Ubiquitin-like protein ATG12 [Tolypocladium ophioglossoides CBS 100239]|uniref:Ubiquitin-like protein ATG12 n=1 Tax=Tolypocladium ophioglossoides (strain CBS 100239) TaxID=1163406 RepID=A0A0L0N2S7_TOLOC|nr:Ubiquitin-like protein ATG12 [Tolypocladium ophioglossoides CBS 100239]